jgi:hypothetical protein
MFHALKWECGAQIIYQSHNNLLTFQSLEMLLLMGNNQDILDQYPWDDRKKINKTPNACLDGLKIFQLIIQSKDANLKWFKKHLGSRGAGQGIEIEADNKLEEDGNVSEDM